MCRAERPAEPERVIVPVAPPDDRIGPGCPSLKGFGRASASPVAKPMGTIRA